MRAEKSPHVVRADAAMLGVEVGHGQWRSSCSTQYIAGLVGGREQRVLRNGGEIGRGSANMLMSVAW